MPAKYDFVRAGRYDIARAVERWGGLYEVRAALLGRAWPMILTHARPCLPLASLPAPSLHS